MEQSVPPPVEATVKALSHSKAITCLVCSSRSKRHHLGVNVCRACAIFYRRTSKRDRKPYVCKKGNGNCIVGQDESASCKKCRFDGLTAILAPEASKTEEIPSPPDVLQLPGPSNGIKAIPHIVRYVGTLAGSPGRPILSRLRYAQDMMCRLRLMGESARHFPQSVPNATTGKYLRRANYLDQTHANQVLFVSLFDFAALAFDEFAGYDQKLKNHLIKSFFFTYQALDTGYRTQTQFGDNYDLYFCGYSLYLDAKDPDFFFAGMQDVNIEEAKKLFLRALAEDCEKYHPTLADLSRIEHEELLAMFGMELFNPTLPDLPESVSALFEDLRQGILKELHIYYTTVLGVSNYAERIGRLFYLPLKLKGIAGDLREIMEIMRLIDFVDDDSYEYRFMRSPQTLP